MKSRPELENGSFQNRIALLLIGIIRPRWEAWVSSQKGRKNPQELSVIVVTIFGSH